MPGLFIIAHAPLASALKLAAQHCFPEAAQSMQVLDVTPGLAPEEIQAQSRVLLMRACQADPRGEALILADVFGATPCNAVQRLADGVHVRVLCGVNVPMVWRALNYASESLDALIARALAGGTQGMMQVDPAPMQNTNCPAPHDQDHHPHQQ